MGILLAYTRCGRGEPVVLLHGLGGHRGVWDPVIHSGRGGRQGLRPINREIPALLDHHEIVAVDLPGFGASAPLPPGDRPTPQRLAEVVAATLDDLAVVRPHVVGNSLGGWVALELAQHRRVGSLTLLSPIGLWRRDVPVYSHGSVLATWLACRFGTGAINALATWGWARRLLFWQVFAHPERLTPETARANVTAMATGAGFWPTWLATKRGRYLRHGGIEAPVTLAFGAHDRVLLRHQSRCTDQLPAHTVAREIPGAGHTPMPDAPAEVAALILRTTATASA